MTLTDESIALLQNEFSILHLIYHRNRNQHRALVWWRYFNMIHRYIRKILDLHGKNRNAMAKVIHELQRKKIMDKAYWEFNSIIALGQFVTLGLTLVGLLAKIWSILEPERVVPEQGAIGVGVSTTAVITATDGDVDFGEEIVDDVPLEDAVATSNKRTISSGIDDIFGPSSKKKKTDTDKSKKKKKKKTKKNDMDDIFG